MREIKFRAWVKETSQMIEHSIIDFNDFLHKDIETYCWNIDILMQYTWLKDKNWKEIYFDDIIQHQEYLYQVVWNVDKIWFIQIKATITDFTIYADWWECLKSNYWRYFERKNLFNFDSCEIKWNIYENPDLMASIANNNI